MMQHWVRKFGCAFRGLRTGTVGQSSFAVHGIATGCVLLAAWIVGCSWWQWCVLGLCIGWVISLELVNSSIEFLARGLCSERNTEVGKALDVASSAVLVASLLSVILGLSIIGGQWLSGT